MYADILKVYKEATSIDDANKIQDNLSKLTEWCEVNKLLLNQNKCCYVRMLEHFTATKKKVGVL